MRFVFKYLFSLSILLCGIFQLSAHGAKGTSSPFYEDSLQLNVDDYSIHHDQVLKPVYPLHKSSQADFFGELENEVEEEETDNHKKNNRLSDYFAAILFTNLPGDYFRYIKKCVPFRKHYGHFSAQEFLGDLCIAFQVMRI